ncbi:hypothetical protein KDW84_32140, partial [Burkholderia vietnamiensis]|nr:hypothetical protein [Burkholderia vietnamiensis]
MSSHIPSHRAATEAARTDDARGPDGTPPDVGRDAVRLDGDVVLSLLALIGGGGAELKDAAGGGQAQGRPASTAPGEGRNGAAARTPPGAPGMRGGAAGLAAPGAGSAAPAGILPALTGSPRTDDDPVPGIVPDEGGDATQRQAAELAAPEDALPLPSAADAGLLRQPGAESAWPSAAVALPMSRTASQYDIGPCVDGNIGKAGEAVHAPAQTMIFAETAGLLAAVPRTGADAPPVQFGQRTVSTAHGLPDAARRASALPATAAPRMQAAPRSDAAQPTRSARDALADAAGA